MFTSILVLYSLDARSLLFVTMKTVSRYCHVFWVQNCLQLEIAVPEILHDIMSAGRGKLLQWPRSVFPEKAVKNEFGAEAIK